MSFDPNPTDGIRSAAAFLKSEMADRIREFNWADTALGPSKQWPQSLKTSVAICLNSQLPMFVWWGPQLINIYNDAYAAVLGKRHPEALGQPAAQVWSDIWPVIKDDVDGVMNQGIPVLKERVRFVLQRNGYAEETFFTYSHSPVPDESGGIGGLIQVCTDETQRVIAERDREKFLESRRVMDAGARTILESITDAFFSLDSEYRFTYVNPQGESLLDRKRGELLNMSIWDAYPAIIGTPFERAYRASMTTRVSTSHTSLYPEHNRWYEVHTYPAVDGGISVYFRDSSDRIRSELALKEIAERYERQSQLFEQIASTTPDFIYIFDLNARVLYANRRLLEVWGKTYEQAIGKSLLELGYPQWHADMHHRELRQVIETKKPIKGEVPFTGGSGISGVYEYIFTPVLGSDGNVEVIAGTTRDVTDRRLKEERIARDAALLANVQDSVIVTDLNGNVTFWNQGATNLFGWTADEMLHKPLVNRLREPSRAEAAKWIEKIAAGGDSYTGEWLDHRKDGSPVWIEVSTRHINDENGRSLGIIGISRDITDRKSAEAEREQLLISERTARNEAERASRMKDEFLATLSHELRTPLNAIVGWASLLAAGGMEPGEVKDGLETIQRNARAQTQIIEDLLDMSRIINGKIRLDVQRVGLESVLQASIDTVKPAADAKGVRIRTVLDSQAGAVAGDPNRLQQVFWNLLSNAVKFTPRNGQVQVLLERVNSHLEITIADTGEGIRPDFLPHVFDRFRQGDASTTRRYGGLGLGLAIVKQLVELHGGTVRVKSPGPGKGSTFTVALPLTVARPEGDSAELNRRHPAVGAESDSDDCPLINGVKVIVVDDEPDARDLVKKLLTDCDAVVRIAATAGEAIRLMAEEKPDVLISDIGMPGEDGYALIKKVRSLSPEAGGQVPAIALTAYARTEDRVRAIRAGFQSHLVKPFEPAELITLVASLAGRTQ